MSLIQVEERDAAIGGQIMSQPITHHIPDLNNATSDKIYELRGSLRTIKGIYYLNHQGRKENQGETRCRNG